MLSSPTLITITRPPPPVEPTVPQAPPPAEFAAGFTRQALHGEKAAQQRTRARTARGARPVRREGRGPYGARGAARAEPGAGRPARAGARWRWQCADRSGAGGGARSVP